MVVSRSHVFVIMASSLVFLFIAWSFKDLVVLNAGLDSWFPRADASSRKTTLTKVAGMGGSVDEFEAFKSELLNPFLKVRDVFSPGHKEVQKHITDHFKTLNWALHEDSFTSQTPLGPANFTNIIATTPYTTTTNYLVLACHYDSKYFDHVTFIGATDSAVPCAILLQLAQALNQYLVRFPQSNYGLKLIFFDGEEALKEWSGSDSIYGAKHLAQVMDTTLVKVSVDKSISELQQISLFVLLDLVGTITTSFKNLQSPTTNEFKKLASIEQQMRSYGLLSTHPSSYFDSSLYNYYIEDDHLPFLQRGVPVVHLISVPFPTEWHQPSDDASCLDYDVINDVMKMMRMFVVDYMGLDVN